MITNPELFPDEGFGAAELPPDINAMLEKWKACPEVVALAKAMRNLCLACAADEVLSRWRRCMDFLEWSMTPESIRMLHCLSEGARTCLGKGKRPPFGSDRFGRYVAFDADFKISNDLLPLYMAATARAFPDIAKLLRADTLEAELVRGFAWNPLQPQLPD